MFTEFKLIIQCNPEQFEVWGRLDGISINVYIHEMVAVFSFIYQHCIVLVIVSLQEIVPIPSRYCLSLIICEFVRTSENNTKYSECLCSWWPGLCGFFPSVSQFDSVDRNAAVSVKSNLCSTLTDVNLQWKKGNNLFGVEQYGNSKDTDVYQRSIKITTSHGVQLRFIQPMG